jgi:hypothetical protein
VNSPSKYGNSSNYGNSILFPERFCTFRIDKVTGESTTKQFSKGSEDIEKLDLNSAQYVNYRSVILKFHFKTCNQMTGIDFFCYGVDNLSACCRKGWLITDCIQIAITTKSQQLRCNFYLIFVQCFAQWQGVAQG